MAPSALAPWGLAGLLFGVGFLTAPFERAAYRTERGQARKLGAYAATVGFLWTLTLAAVWLCGGSALMRSPAATPAAWLPAPGIVAPVIAGAAGLYVLLALMPLVQSLRGERWRMAYAAATRRMFAALPGFLPNTGAERAAFVLVSLTAGVCEEILYRGFLIRFLHAGAPTLPILAALAASSVAFGLSHAYQGLRGMVTTMVAGFLMGALFLLSGSLAAVMALHALMDLQIAYVLRPPPGGAATPAPNLSPAADASGRGADQRPHRNTPRLEPQG